MIKSLNDASFCQVVYFFWCWKRSLPYQPPTPPPPEPPPEDPELEEPELELEPEELHPPDDDEETRVRVSWLLAMAWLIASVAVAGTSVTAAKVTIIFIGQSGKWAFIWYYIIILDCQGKIRTFAAQFQIHFNYKSH